jgi:hypothetical protein
VPTWHVCACVWGAQVLDVPTPVLSVLLVQGVLVFDPTVAQLSLDAEYIFVFGGTLEVGTREAPFPGQAVITVHGTLLAPLHPVRSTLRAALGMRVPDRLSLAVCMRSIQQHRVANDWLQVPGCHGLAVSDKL